MVASREPRPPFSPRASSAGGSEVFLSPEERERRSEAVRRLVAGEAPAMTMQHRLRKKGGEYAEVETVSSVVPGSRGEAPRSLRITREITEGKARESRPVGG